MNKFYLSVVFFCLFSIKLFSQNATQEVFFFTGGQQFWTVPACVNTISVEVNGASGGGASGGLGASVSGTITVTPGEVLQINVGGQGGNTNGGFNGGGNGASSSSNSDNSYGGGGASDIRTAPYQLNNRLVVAAGGGGMGGGNTDAEGGIGGCTNGLSGTSPFGVGGSGASQANVGAGGPPWISSGNYGSDGQQNVGGNGASDPCYDLGPGGGGGGGYFGGGGGGSDCYANYPLGGGGGGGGSSYFPNALSCVDGTNQGNGFISIEYTSSEVTATDVQAHCDSYTWINGITYTQNNNSATYVTNSASGCDSVVTLSLTIFNSPLLNIPTVEVCEGSLSAQITASAANGAPPYFFNWGQAGNSNSEQLNLSLVGVGYNGGDISTILDLVQSVSVTDGNGCTTSVNQNIVDVIPDPNPETINY